MEEVNRLALKQQELGEKITKSMRNMKKDPPARKTLEYVTKRLGDLEEVWTEAEENHSKIVALKKEEHNYHTTQFFSQMQRRYDETLGYLNALKDGVEAAPNPGKKDEEQLNRIKMQELRINKLSEKLRKIQEESVDTHTKEYYDTKKSHIITWWNPIEMLDDEIQLAGTEQQEEYFREEKFQKIYLLYDEVLNQLLDKSDTTGTQSKQCNITLPKITIPIFEGRYEKWNNFYELFNRIIDSNTTLTKVEKMQYLTTNLRGEARKVIQHLQLAEANYETAWELLKNRYENKRLVLNKMLDRILDLPAVTQESADKLKNLYDTTIECVEAIKNMGIDTTTWGPMVMRILARKWDGETNKMYEQTLKSPHEIQEFPVFMEFLMARFQSLEAMAESKTKRYPDKTLTQGKWPQWKPTSPSCTFCQQQHLIYFCQKFKDLSISERNQAVNQKKLCKMCLVHDASQKCSRPRRCKKCNQEHNELLHKDQTTPQRGQQATKSTSHIGAVAESTAQEEEEVITVANHVGRQKQDVLLATALVRAKTVTGSLEMLRVLVDPGSQASFITEEAAQLLALPKQKIRAEISGLGASNPKEARSKVTVEVQPRFPSTFRLTTELMVLSKVTQILPSTKVEGIKMEKWQNYLLADPTFNKPGPIDVLLGAADYTIILQEGILKTEAGLLGQNTEFGWVLSGCQGTEERNNIKIVSMMTRIDEELTRFWEIEEIPENQKLSNEDVMCEEHYAKNHKRNEDGTYTVKIPFKEEQPQLGESKQRAMARFFQLEKRLAKDRKLGDEYKQFMQEYLDLGHMRRILPHQEPDAAYYIPHQAVIKETSTTTKLRVVFDASSKTSNGVSLNERMLTGPRLQQDLFDTILRWRKHSVAFTADIEKMYRQIRMHEEDQKYQRILWRFEPTQPIQEYGLTTVTYGTTAAPYLAIKTLQQLAQDEQENFPKAFPIIMKDFYVDDLLSGADSEEEAHQVQSEIIKMLKTGGFTIRKWASNKTAMLRALPEELVDQSTIQLTEDGVKKTLGVYWKPADDIFQFKVECSNKEATTKRLILSEIAKLFDPLGWLAPIVIKAKMMVQELWTIESGWDQEVPGEIKNRWLKFHSELKSVEEIKFPRWIKYSKRGCRIELHGFADASEKAYGAVIYSKTTSNAGETNITLLVAKSKVAPIKMKKTLPRLELCAAVLLAKLLKRTKVALELEDVPTFAWTDSMITIAWIKGEPGKWKTFVANRVSEIQEELPNGNWNHVRTEDNPADVISRGIEPPKLKNHLIWWNGPDWLKETTHWPRMEIIPTQEEARVCHQTRVVEKEEDITERFSSWLKMTRVISHCNRFVRNCKQKTKDGSCITVAEMENTQKQIVRMVQQVQLKKEIQCIRTKGQLEKQNKISNLSPYIDEENLLRVGGRLENSALPYDEKHPMIIPHGSHLSKLIIQDAHHTTLHGGSQLTSAYIRRKFWIINGKKAINSVINKCVRCRRYKAQVPQQIMGNLPAARVNQSSPFTHTGVDYAGPIQIRMSKGRGNKSYKGYIAVFVCLATKAIHLEAVSDMSSEAFLAAFKRFIARRGRCAHMYSDNGTNFVGANKILENEVLTMIKDKKVEDDVISQGIQWHFIPPAAPHFGGLWEAGVKSMKHHLKRVIGDSTLTFEELTTLLDQIEACLNSRPLCPISNNVNDTIALTPGHFLVGKALITPPNPITTDVETNISQRWKMVNKAKRDFWKAWSSEYLNRLQQRYKWKTKHGNIQVGELVLIKDDNISPCKWPLARVQEVYPAKDGTVRVVSIKQSDGTILKRPITKIIPLADGNKEEDDNQETINVNVAMVKKNKPPEEQPKNRNNMPMGVVKYMLLLMLLGSCINNMVQATYTIKYPKPGLYVEHIGSAQIDRGTFRIEVKFPKERIKEDEEAVNTTVAQMEDFCNHIRELTEHAQCVTLTHHLSEQQEQLKWSIRSMEGIISRHTRGVLGNLLTSIFGVNDEVYKDIEALDKNQHDLIRASNHQTKFMLSAVSTFNETEVRIQQKLNQFREKLNQGLDAIKEMEKWYRTIDENKLNLHILNTYQVVTNYVEELQLQYNKLLDVHFERGHLYEFISPAHVSEIISTANEKLPSGIKVLDHPILKTKVVHSQQYIHIFGYLVIAEITEFTVINVTPIPLKAENGTYWTLEVPSEILAIDYNSQAYFELTREEYEKSIFLQNNKLLCTPTVVRSIENSPHCIIDEIYSRKENNTCKIRKDQIWTIIWKQLSTKNTWMFIIDKPTRIAVTCNGNREDVKLNTSGIIQISQDCIIKTQQNILTPKMFDNIPVLAGFAKHVQVHLNTSVTMESNNHHPIQKEPVFKDTEQLRTLVNEERNIQEDLHGNTWRRIRNHSVISSSVTTSIIVITAVIAFLLYKCYTKTKQQARKPRKTATTARSSTTEVEMQPLYSEVNKVLQSNISTSSRTPQNV